MSEILAVGDLTFEVRRSLRRRTLGLTVDRKGDLVVHSPARTDRDELRRWVEQRLLWVHEKLLHKEKNPPTIRILEPVTGESIPYLGRNYRLKIVDRQPSPLCFDGEWFYLRRKDREKAHDHFQRWYREKGALWLEERIRYWEPRTGIPASGITVRDLGFRWGSCGKKGILHFNWRLMQLPVQLIDYVIAHELVHLREKNHTPAFWEILGRALPDWQRRKSELSHRCAGMEWRIEKLS